MWLGFLFFFGLKGLPALAQTESRQETWLIWQMRWAPEANSPWGLWMDYVRRDLNGFSGGSNLIQYFRPSVEWRFSSQQWIWLGWGYLDHPMRSDGESRGYAFHFYRWNSPAGLWPWRLQHRLGYEYRHFLKEGSHGSRWRWRLAWETPVESSRRWWLTLSDEVFYAWSGRIRGIPLGLTENRLIVGLQWDSPKFKWAVMRLWGYQEVLRQQQRVSILFDGWMLQGQLFF